MPDPNGELSARQEQGMEMCCPVVELRQYTEKPGQRDDLIALFEEHFLEGQERYGMRIIGQFRNCNDPDQFVWMRGFADMQARQKALEGFYSGPIWEEYGNAASDTMIDSSNVLLLRPARATSGFRIDPTTRPALDAPETQEGIITATIYSFDELVDANFVDFFERDLAPVLRDAGAKLVGYFVTEPSENTYKPLPVREGENVFVWFTSFADRAAYAAYQTTLAESQAWTASLAPALKKRLSKPEEALELVPGRRSLLRSR
jgi:hypothetical protein